jgi:hypothetical protein
MTFLAGNKTYIVCAGAILTAFGAWLGKAIDTTQLIQAIFAALGAAAIRSGVTTEVAKAVDAASLTDAEKK